MVCKKDVVTWFKSLKSYKRVDVMCSLLQLCVPFELRFLGTCLEDLAKRDFQDLRQTENEANNISELNSPEVQCLSNQEIRTKLALYVSLLHSCNDACSNRIFKILTKDDISSVLKLALTDDNVLEELLSIYTLALNHPAFSFDQKIALDKIFSKLQEEELRLLDQGPIRNKQTFSHPNLQDSIHEKPQPTPFQSYQTCIALDEHQQCFGVTNAGPCQPIPQPHLPPKAYITYGESFVGDERRIGCQQTGAWGGNAAAPVTGDSSPLVSRTNSPCQSPSRPASPPRHIRNSPPTARAQPPLIRELTKEMPAYVHNLHNYTVEQLSRMNDDELREIGLPPNAILQLRTILTKQQVTANGIPTHPPHAIVDLRKKPEAIGSPMLVRSVDSMYQGGGGVCLNNAPCYSCFSLAPRGPKYPAMNPPPPLYPAALDGLKALRLDQESNSSASDTASDHSPPDTPGPEGAPPPTQRRQPPPQPRGRVHQQMNPHSVVYRRREGVSNGCEERKVFSGENPGYFSPGGWPQHHYIRPAAYPAPPFSFVRPPPQPYPFQPNGEMVYPYPAYPPPPYPPPPHIPPAKISCYNCGSPSHAPVDCPESTMEEITKQGQYRIDYAKQQQAGSSPPSEQTDK